MLWAAVRTMVNLLGGIIALKKGDPRLDNLRYGSLMIS